MNDLKIFSGRANPDLTRRLCDYLGLPMGGITIGNFPDSEISCKVEEDIRGRDVFLVQPTCPPVNEYLMELLIMIESCKRASAERITAVMPYYGYARQDRKDEGRVPITAKLVANIITRAGADRVLAMDMHLAPEDIVVVSPDEGSIKRALGHAERLGAKLAIVDKRRADATHTKQENIIGAPVEGKVALLFDDMISTAGSICGAAQVIHERGAKQIYVAATHGVLCGPAIDHLKKSPIHEVVITDTIPLRAEQTLPMIKVLSVAPLLGEAIKRIHRNESVSRLFD